MSLEEGEGNEPKTVVRRVRAWGRWLRRLLLRRLPAEEAQKVRDDVERNGGLTERYLLMCALSAGIATLGLLQSSTAVVIGAMLVSPLMAPIASLGFAFASLSARRAEDAAKVVGLGALVGVLVGMAITWISPIHNATPEIVARTAPTLLDLAIAVLSGMAGGYATVHRQGETAIGVAIATALMPPLATLGYSLAVGNFNFALGATLLFLTNLAAISFSFAVVARVRGVERPFSWVKLGPVHALLGVGLFLVLATPLALTLKRVTDEAFATQAARQLIENTLGIDRSEIAQIEVATGDSNAVRISATAITDHFSTTASDHIRRQLSARLQRPVEFELQQIVASDPRAQTEAMVQAALSSVPRERADAGAAPTVAAVAASRFESIAVWPVASTRSIQMLMAPRPGTSLSAFRAEEQRLNQLGLGWSIELIPPFEERLSVFFGDDEVNLADDQLSTLATMIWALQRWRVREVWVDGVSGFNQSAASRRLARARATALATALSAAGFSPHPDAANFAIARDAANNRDRSYRRCALVFPFGRPVAR